MQLHQDRNEPSRRSASAPEPATLETGPWWRRRLTWRDLVRGLVAALVLAVPSVCFGVATASAEASLGPHLADYEVTLDHRITVDLGPLGTLVVDSPLPAVLGARVVVKEIPREVTAVGGGDTLESVGSDLQSYVQFFSAPQATLHDAVDVLVEDAIRRSVLAAVVLTAGAWGLGLALGGARRRELALALGRHRGGVSAVVVLALLAEVTLTASAPADARRSGETQASAVFNGTPLEGARITGRLAGIVDTYGGKLVDAYRTNESFYDRTVGALEASWETRRESDARLEEMRRARLVAAQEPRATATAAPDGGTAQSPEPTPTPTPGPAVEPVTLLVVSDLHCNVGMARVMRAAVEQSGAQVVLNAGDTTINGTAVEQYCVTTFMEALPAGVRMVVADGNHDSSETGAQEAAAGAVVLSGSTVEVDGVRILGDSDPNATRIGVGTTLTGSESLADSAERLADTACAEPGGVDLLLIHNPNMGNTTMDLGCARAQVSGHLHRRRDPVVRGGGVRYVSSTTAGAALNQATVGPLNGVAEMTVLRFDPASRRVMDYRLVLARPDGTVSVGLALPWPGVPVPREPERGPR